MATLLERNGRHWTNADADAHTDARHHRSSAPQDQASSNDVHVSQLPRLQGSSQKELLSLDPPHQPDQVEDAYDNGKAKSGILVSQQVGDTGSASSALPQINLETPSTASPTPKDTSSRWPPISSATIATSPSTAFQGLSLDFSSAGLSEEIGTNNLKFSARGSMLIDGKKVNGGHIISAKTMPLVKEPVSRHEQNGPTTRKRAVTSIADRPQTRIMSTDEEALSEKVRAFYSLGTDALPDPETQSTIAKKMNLRWQDAMQDNRDSLVSTSRATSMTDLSRQPTSPGIPRDESELAGGVEDWQDVDNADVDRYGFIIPKSPTSPKDDTSQNSIKRTPTITAGPGLQRVSTSLQLAAETPRRKHTIRRAPSNARSSKSEHDLRRSPSNHSMRSSKSVNLHRHHSASRAIANKLPHNRDRRVLDEAGDMLTLPRSSTTNTLTRTLTEEGTSSTSTATYASTSTPQSRRKELERQTKWERMAKRVPSPSSVVGGGTVFTFDTTSSKLIERTWKGIPDTWRATAWSCFLASSVTRHNKRHPSRPCLSDEALTDLFHTYQTLSSPDDVQIDIDVPRTISSHIMFRRRYRGGQRLLFRVLHAMSCHFADTGYVQGMAALAATLLAYYEETQAFIMLVRLWELRGLEKLYKHGFGGLMEALNDFETQWLGQGELRKKLDDLMVGPTAYGTRWYLTLFNYSIPFPCQLRVWDVFMLLGDNEDDHDEHIDNDLHTYTPPTNPNIDTSETPLANIDRTQEQEKEQEEKANFGTTLDVLHAASAALIDGMRGILLESDFENAMKVLTSWVPIRDEDLFMRVARAEWKMNLQRRKNATKKS